MYTIFEYGRMISDQIRLDAYIKALGRAIRPGSVVVDIGTGTGIFALLACRFGARRVYAIDSSDAVSLGRQMAHANGYSERIQFIQNLSTEVDLAERADVVVSDIRGILPFLPNSITAIADARKRFLAPGGTLIPQKDELYGALVEVPGLYGKYVDPWTRGIEDLDMRAALPVVTNACLKLRVEPGQLLTVPQLWETVDYTRVTNPDVAGKLLWKTVRSGTAHGVCVWFESTMLGDVRLSNSPHEPELLYGSLFFPWSAPVQLDAEDTVSIVIRANLVGQEYVWRWDTEVLSSNEAGRVKARFRQSTFFGAPLSSESLRKCDAAYLPSLNEEGLIDRFVLQNMDGRLTSEEIARLLLGEFPNRFPSPQTALNRVSALVRAYAE